MSTTRSRYTRISKICQSLVKYEGLRATGDGKAWWGFGRTRKDRCDEFRLHPTKGWRKA